LAVCKLITLISTKSKLDVETREELLEKVSSFILNILSKKLSGNPATQDEGILKKVLIISTEIIKSGNSDFTKKIIFEIIQFYQLTFASEKSLIFLHFIYSNYVKDHFRNSDCLDEFHKTLLDKFLFSLKKIKETKQAICKITKTDKLYRHHKLLLQILQYSHIRHEINYINQLPNKIIELIEFLIDCNKSDIFCCFTKSCFTCTSLQQQILSATLQHVNIITCQLTKVLCTYCISTHSGILRTVVGILGDFVSNKSYQTNKTSFHQIKYFLIMILTAGTLDDHNNKIESATSNGLKQISDNCSFILETWKMWFAQKLFGFPNPIKLYLNNFLLFPSAAFTESWVGFLSTLIFVSNQPIFEEITKDESTVEGFGRFLAICFKTSYNDEDLNEIYKLSIEAFKISHQIRLHCLQDLIIEDEDVDVLVDLAQNDDLYEEMSSLSDYIIENLQKTLIVRDSDEFVRNERFERFLLIKTYLRRNIN